MYQISISNQATKTLKNLPNYILVQILKKIEDLKSNPRPTHCKKLKDRDAYRIRINNYRVIYNINDNKLLILVIAIGHRKNIYN